MMYIGAETMISPMGASTEENWKSMLANRSAIGWVDQVGLHHEKLPLARFDALTTDRRFHSLVFDCLQAVSQAIDASLLWHASTQVIVSATKGAVDDHLDRPFDGVMHPLQKAFDLKRLPLIVSNACISGVQAINIADELVAAGEAEHVIVIAADLASQFVINGFQSLYAISDKPCAPFDIARKGITLGEAAAGVVVSRNRGIFKEEPLSLLAGYSSNDANHISGPSRTGEGLVRAVRRTMARHQKQAADLDLLSVHGTATQYNDEMEAIAINRLGLQNLPLLSLKGYFGHTLGAAGVLETVATMQMLRHGVQLKSLGFEKLGTSQPLNVLANNKVKEFNCFLKTASGFGGGNAALMVEKI
ncbi:beta-ketoacyl synthase N-terminal-like domain-containing protein [Dyadobacter tibetensis]|uniref:beta-ketoacyl synthase N-terminal-like domain-containing protein n=1 Tax=Dyadobacter tibetensis TaxID=1211851 RepID=UPI00046F1272|nr:beta-ketoacyl synthase N-terminal-like domain-containing protein [Dyadobacter tibetensis]